MSRPLPASGWENPDNHPPITARPRPMYDGDGKPVTEMPPDDPAPELAKLLPGALVDPPQPSRIMLEPGEEVFTLPEILLVRKLAGIADLAEKALDDDKPGRWAAALAEIVRLAR